MTQPYAFQEIRAVTIILWISADSTLAEIQRFVGIMGIFHAEGSVDPLCFTLTPKRALKARLLYHAGITVVRPLPHPRFSHPTTGKRVIRLSEAINISRTLSGIPPGERLTTRSKIAGL